MEYVKYYYFSNCQYTTKQTLYIWACKIVLVMEYVKCYYLLNLSL